MIIRLRTLSRLVYVLNEHFNSEQIRNIYYTLKESAHTYRSLNRGKRVKLLTKPLKILQNYAVQPIIGYTQSNTMSTVEISKATNLKSCHETSKYRATIEHPTPSDIPAAKRRTQLSD